MRAGLKTIYAETLSVERATKTFAALFMACGALVAVAMPLLRPPIADGSEVGVLLVALVAMASGPVIWFLPWARWGRSATLPLIPLSLSMIALFNTFARLPYLYPVFFLVVFVWIGLFHARGTGLSSSPLLAIAYLAPILSVERATSSGLRSLAVLLPVAVVLAEIVAWVAEKLRAAEHERARSKARLRALLENSSDMVSLIARDGKIMFHSPPYLLGHNEEENAGRGFLDFIHPEDMEAAQAGFAQALTRPGTGPVVACRIRAATGDWRWFECVGRNCFDDPEIGGLVINSRDVTDRRAVESKIEFQALHDSVTGLPNRDFLLRRMEQAMGDSGRRGARAAVLFFDIDDFKLINDSHGHAEGDRVLVAVADRLRQLVAPPAVLARFGGDEFAVLCPAVQSRKEPLALAAAIEEAMVGPLQVGTRIYHLSVSIGVSFADSDFSRSEELLRDADAAMYAAKSSGRASVRVFDDELRSAAVRRLDLEQSLRRALEQNELEVHYQAEVELPARRVRGAEALLRWRHGSRGLLDARGFISVAEEARLIVPIGEWLLRRACLEASRWGPAGADPPLVVAVNLSACELIEDALPRRVESALEAAGLEPGRLCLEITERLLMVDQRLVARVLGALKEIGVRLALDDFGAGYSSLTYLRRYPVDRLKIDRSFVEGLGRDRGDATIVRAVLELAERLGMEAVAKGVENGEQHDTLVHLGCTRAQGRHYGKVADGDAFSRLLEQRPVLRVIAGSRPA